MPTGPVYLTRSQLYALMLGKALAIVRGYDFMMRIHRLIIESPVIYTHQAIQERTAVLWSKECSGLLPTDLFP